MRIPYLAVSYTHLDVYKRQYKDAEPAHAAADNGAAEASHVAAGNEIAEASHAVADNEAAAPIRLSPLEGTAIPLSQVKDETFASGVLGQGMAVIPVSYTHLDVYKRQVDSSADKKSPDYLTSSYIKAQQMPERLVIETRDQAGYVMELTADGNTLEGEAFRQGMGLASSNFTIQKVCLLYTSRCV